MPQQDSVITGIRHSNKIVLWLGLIGAALWIGMILIHAGAGGILSFLHAFVFLGVLMVVGSATRTVTWPTLVLLFASGAFAGSVAVLVLRLIDAIGITFSNPLRPFAVALIDMAFMLAPLLLLLWRARAGLCLIGVTDVLLMAAACGTGFGFVEHAFVIHRVPSVSWLWWMPLSGVASTQRDAEWLINSHGVLAAIAGATIGVALLFRHRGKAALLLAASGVAYGLADRLILGSLGHDAGNQFLQGLASLLGWGWLTLWLLLAAVVVAVLLDACVIYLKMPDKVKPLANQGSAYSRAWWSTQLEMRAVAFAGFHYAHDSGAARSAIAGPSLAVLSSLVKRYKKLHPDFEPRLSPPPPADQTTESMLTPVPLDSTDRPPDSR